MAITLLNNYNFNNGGYWGVSQMHQTKVTGVTITTDSLERDSTQIIFNNLLITATVTVQTGGLTNAIRFTLGKYSPSTSPNPWIWPYQTDGAIDMGHEVGPVTGTLGIQNAPYTVPTNISGDIIDQYSMQTELCLVAWNTVAPNYQILYHFPVKIPHGETLYGSVNGQSKAIRKLYGSVNGRAKEIQKLYGSVNGVSKRIY